MARFSEPEIIVRELQLHPDATVADFGVGSGYYTIAAARLLPAGLVYAIDIQSELLRRIKTLAGSEGLQNVEILTGDVTLPKGSGLPDGSVDVVIVANVLFQVEDKKALVREVKRVLMNGGRVLVVDWEDSFGGVGPIPSHVVKEDDAKLLFMNNGFKLVRSINAGSHHYGFIARDINQ